MLSELIRQVLAAIGVLFRTMRSIVMRQVQSLGARLRNATSLSRQAAKAAPALLKKVTDVGKKPTRREDYIETKQMFISKSFLVSVVLVLAAVGLIAYFAVWPFLMSRFFTAKFWCEDPKTEDYTGRVILYYEKEKETKMFQGRLEEGVIQGPGEGYDESGLLVYSGNYLDGVYNGAGKLYEAGILRYEGAFTAGLFDGEGTLYEESGAPEYEGGFSAGVRSGEGTAYLNGERLYKGAFEGDLYNGDGILYIPGGGTRYRGTFVDGLYSGSGVLTLDSGATVQAEFEQGDVIGDARCFLNGKLYYEGSLRNLVPDGMGTLYNASGKALYTGPMKYGVIDGGALLEMTAADLRELLEEPAETSYDQGFAITCEALGFAAFCSYAQEDADPMVYRVYVYAPEDSRALSALLWKSPEEFEELSREDGGDEETQAERLDAVTAAVQFPLPLPVELGKEADCQPYRYGGYSLNLWSVEGSEMPGLLEWRLGEALPEALSRNEEPSAAAAQMDALIEKLGLVSDRLADGGGGAGAGDAGASGGGGAKNDKNGEALLKAVGEDGDVYAVLTAALRYLELQELRNAAEENLDLYREMAEDEQSRIDAGTGDEENLSSLEDSLAQMEVQVTKYTAQMRREARTIEEATDLQAYEFELSDMLLLFEVSSLDVDALGDAVIATAEDAARKQAEEEAAKKKAEEDAAKEAEDAEGSKDAEGSDAAGEGAPGKENASEGGQTEGTAPAGEAEGSEKNEEEAPELVIPEIDRQALLDKLEDDLLDLELAYQDVKLAHRSYETALVNLEDVKDRHNVGEVEKSAVQGAQATANDRRGLLYSAMAAFSRQAAVLDASTGGAVAKAQGWLTGVLGK